MNSTYSKHDARHKVLECLLWSFNVLCNLAANACARCQFVLVQNSSKLLGNSMEVHP